MELVKVDRPTADMEAQWLDKSSSLERRGRSPWTHIENLTHRLRTYGDSTAGIPRQGAYKHKERCVGPLCNDLGCVEQPIKPNKKILGELQYTKTRVSSPLLSSLFLISISC